MPSVKVTQPEGKEVPTEVLSSAIVSIADGIKKLRSGRLNDRALFLLIQHASPGSNLSQRDIKAVLSGIESLERIYLKKK